jgi:hypothetical protein
MTPTRKDGVARVREEIGSLTTVSVDYQTHVQQQYVPSNAKVKLRVNHGLTGWRKGRERLQIRAQVESEG